MKISSAALILFLFTSTCVATKFSSVEDSQYLKCDLEARSSQWSRGSPAIVSLSIENTSLKPKKFVVSSFFEMGEMQYWGPVKLENVSEHLQANTHYELFLKAEQKKTFEVDLSKLKWGRSISSIWPHLNFFDLVAPGDYKLIFYVYIESEGISKRIYSNSLDVIIR
jgi:hypothetical protein